MPKTPRSLPLANLANLAGIALLLSMGLSSPAPAQIAGGTSTVDTSTTTTTQIAMGWSVKHTLLGKTVYNDSGKKVGRVEDLIVSPDRNVSYVIVGAGGFIGIGRHDVAIPVSQIRSKDGQLVMAGATKDMIKAMPAFTYASDTHDRDEFVSAAERDITRGKVRIGELEQAAGAATPEARSKVDLQLALLRGDVKAAETRLNELKQATPVRWKEYEANVNEATVRLRQSLDKSAG